MVIEAKHFDTRLNQWIHNDNNPSNADSLLKEELKNSLLEHFFPEAEFSFGHMDEKATPDQLKNHPEGHKLLLSSKSRLLYGPEEYLETISKLCPDNKDRGAYGSIFLGSCKNAINAELNILIVDDSTGKNGGIINNDQAYRLTGDCYGQISTELYQQLTGHQKGDQYRVIQHRFGWTDKDGNDDKFRFGKGILRPANLDQILNYQNPNQPKIDLIIPLSAFKGTDKDNPNGPTKPQIKPGLYRQNIWLGEKSQSELGKTAISQMIASFPNGLKDFAETVELEAAKLKKALDDPRKIAQLYCEKYEKRKTFLEQQAAELEEEAAVDQEVAEEFEKLQERIATDTNIYKLIKTDLEGWGQLLETEKIQRELARFVQGEWQDISVGKTLTFERAMVIPSKDLRDGEVCIPHYQDSEQVLNFRSPFLNSNGLCSSTNKIVDDIIGPDGKPLASVVAVSDETSERIYNRLNSQIKSILPELQEKNIQLESIENYLDQNIGKLETTDKIEFTNNFNEYIKQLNNEGYQLEILPQESEQERQARDYDGDCIGFDHASKYPNLTAEAIWRNVPENAYEPTVKLKKQSFYRENGTQPEFEEIAIHMSDGISVGVINNHLTSIEALESEITILKTFGSEKDQIEYVIQVAKHYEKLFDQENSAQAHGDTSPDISNKYRGYMEEFVQTLRQEPLTQENALFAMDINTRIYREMVAEAAFQNQIAVDLFKSAKKPEMDVIRNNSRILHREVNYIRDKKKDVYFDSTIEPTGYSPVEILISKTNQYFEKAQLESRELTQFSNLFKGVEFTYEQRLQATLAKREFDKEFNNATRYTQRKKTEKGSSASIDIGNGQKLDVTNLLKYDHPLIWNAHKITLKVSEIPPEKRSIDKPHQYRVYAQINDETENAKPKFKTLGTVSKEQENSFQELGIVPNREITSTKISFQPELSEGQIKLMYQKAYQIAEDFYNSISDSEAGRDRHRVLEQKLAMAAATWAVSTTREGSNSKSQQNEVEQEVERQKKVSNFVFASFTQEIIQQVDKLQFTNFTLTGHKHKSETIKQVNQNNPQEIRFNISEQKDSRGNTVIKDVIEVKNPETGEYETFANINATDGKLPIGTTATGTIEKGEVYTATAKINIPGGINLEFQVKELQKFQCKDQNFNGEEVNLIILKDKLEREDYVITFKNGYKEEKLGTLSKESVIAGIEQGWLAEKPGQGGQKVQLEITSIATGENAFAIGKTASGNLVRIDINDKLKNINFHGQEITATVKAYDKQDVYTAKIGNLSLGIIGQHTEKAFGNRSRYSQKKSTVQQLVDAGIINESKVQTTIPVILTSNETTCKLTIDPESVQYPETWVKRYQLVDQQKKTNPVEQKNNQLFDKITERPTILFQSEEDKLVGLVGLAVDSKKSEVTKEFLERVGITYDQVAKSQSRLEAKKGMTVFMLDESTITPKRKEQFLERFGGIKSNDTPPLPAPIIPEQTVYFSHPNQQYTLEDNSQVIKESIGLVVPAQDAILVNSWLEYKDTNNNYIIEKTSNVAIFIIEKDTVSSELEKGLTRLLGEAINLGEIDGFYQYEQLSNELNQKVEKEGSLLEINSTPQPSQYKQALQSLPNCSKEISKEEIPLPIVPAKPVQEDSTNDKELNIIPKPVSPISKTVVEVNPPTEKIVQAVELSKLGDFDSSITTFNDQEVEWVACIINVEIPDRNNQDEWLSFTETVAEEITVLEAATKNYLSPVSENIFNILELKTRAAQQSNQSLLDEANTRKETEIAKYGQEIYNELESKAQLALLSEQTPEALPEVVVSIGSVAARATSEGIAAAVITKDKQQIQLTQVLPKLETTTSQTSYSGDIEHAEYQSLINGLTEAASAGYKSVRVETSNGKFLENFDRPRENLKPLHKQAKTLLQQFEKYELGWQHHLTNPAYRLASTTAHEISTAQFITSDTTQQPQLPINNPSSQNQGNGDALVSTTAAILPPRTEPLRGISRRLDATHIAYSTSNENTIISNQPSIQEIITIGNQTAARAQNPQIPEDIKIAGKVPMVYSLLLHGEPPKLPVNTTIDAMRGHSRVHTTRGVDYQKAYGIKEGDIAVALGKNGKQVAFRVGKQYEITPQMIQNPAYQQAWANWEKHSVKELTQTQAQKGRIYGLFMEPLGDYVNGKIVPFVPTKQPTTTTVNISPDSSDGLGAALSNATMLAKEQGKLQNDYPVSLGNNPTAPAGQYGTETHTAKAEGVPYTSAEQAFNHQKQINPSFCDEYKLMVTVLQAKLEQHPRLAETITKRGGTKWLENCTNITNSQDKQWEGKGKESASIRALSEAYTNVVEKNIAPTPENTATTSEVPSDTVTQQKTSKSTKNQAFPINTKPEQIDIGKTTSTENLPTQLPQFAPGINLNSRSPDPLGAVLTSTTVKSKQIGTIANDYPVSFRNNKEMPAGTYGLESYTESKPAAQPFLSAEQAFYAYKETVPLKEPRVQLMAEILQARFEQHPKLAEAITKRGGDQWLKQCSYLVSSGEKNFWEGKGLESPYIRALIQGYTKALENSNSQQAENYTAEAIQLTSNQKLESEPQGKNTETSFTPKLNAKNISPPTSVKNQTESSHLNTDVQQALLQTSTNTQTKSIDKTLDNIKESTIQNLQNWYQVAHKLGRNEKYIARIQEVTKEYINESSYSLENAFQAMSRDIKELQQIDEMTTLVQRVVQIFGKEDVNGIMSVRTENYKNYQIATQAQEKTYLIKDKDSNILLYIRDGKTQVNNLNEQIVNDFRFMNSRIENRLESVKIEII
ncbi:MULTISPECIES: reverse transcriptase-like protein [Brasilonema]|uniref:RNase H type-1 domain-containing protein n=1 Tax=Brasilonema octagenarum UFV-OR1 TaxID=417115 RepID=A0ABX1M7U3_9CYAN|nr:MULTISPECIES: reverse transcriptase-like protein [Brasilonema]NMF64628.1 hypothetical protein [Brasilonema octagenarum UFV-OR1]